LLSWIFWFAAKDRITPPEEKAIKDVPNVEELLN
jgi:hypothetical protein